MNMKKIKAYFLLLIIVFFLSGCNNQSDKITVGASLPLTGDFASYGKRAQNGIELAVAEINESEKYDFSLEVDYQDNQGTAKEAANIMNKFATINNYPIVIGGASSMESLAMLPIANKNEVVIISPISSSAELSKDDYFFRVCPSDAFQASMMANWLDEKDYSNVAILYINSNWGVSLKNRFVEEYKNKGGNIGIIESMNEGEKDFKTHITKILKKKPDAIYCISYGAEGGIILRQLKELGYNKDIYGADVWSSPELLESAGKAANGAFLIKPAEPSNDKFTEFQSKYNEKYEEMPDVYAAYSYDVAYIIANALNEMNKEGKAIKDYFLKMEGFIGTTGLTEFDKLGDCNTKNFQRLFIKDKKIQPIN